MNSNKPVVIRLREAKENIISAVKAAMEVQDLPCYLIEPIISEVYTQISTGARREYEIAEKQFSEKTTDEGGQGDGP